MITTSFSEARQQRIPADGYVMRVVDTYIDNKFNRLQLMLDIDDGDFKDYYKRLDERASFWGMTLNLYLDKKSQWRFAKAIDAFRASNDGFEWNDDGENDETTLVGKLIGIVTREKEYMGNDGVKKSKIVPYATISVDDIRRKNFKIPEPDLLDEAPPETIEVVDTTDLFYGPVKDEDIPF